jgi:hypothetical protein
MPQWLCNQMMSAFSKKDRRQIRLLNECWFYYHARPEKTNDTLGINP